MKLIVDLLRKGLRTLRAKIGPLQKRFHFANFIALLMQFYKIKVTIVTAIPFRKYFGAKLSATCAFTGVNFYVNA